MVSTKKSLKVIGFSSAQTAKCIRIVDPSSIPRVDEKPEKNAVDFEQQVVSFVQMEDKSLVQQFLALLRGCNQGGNSSPEELEEYIKERKPKEAVDMSKSSTTIAPTALAKIEAYTNYLNSLKEKTQNVTSDQRVTEDISHTNWVLELQRDIIRASRELKSIETFKRLYPLKPPAGRLNTYMEERKVEVSGDAFRFKQQKQMFESEVRSKPWKETMRSYRRMEGKNGITGIEKGISIEKGITSKKGKKVNGITSGHLTLGLPGIRQDLESLRYLQTRISYEVTEYFNENPL